MRGNSRDRGKQGGLLEGEVVERRRQVAEGPIESRRLADSRYSVLTHRTGCRMPLQAYN